MEDKTLLKIVELIHKDKMLPNNDPWTEGYCSGIVDAWIYLEQGKSLNFYPWNGLPWNNQPTFSEVLKNE